MAHAVTSYTMSFYNKLEHREGGMEGKSLHLHSASEQNEALEQSIFFMDHLYGGEVWSPLLDLVLFFTTCLTLKFLH